MPSKKPIKAYSYSGYGSLNRLPGKYNEFRSVEEALSYIDIKKKEGRLHNKQILLIDYSSSPSKIVHIIEATEKPKKIKVGVLCGSISIYLNWIDVHGKQGEDYFIINDLKNAQGHIFDRIERLAGYNEVPQIKEIEEYIRTHKRNNPSI